MRTDDFRHGVRRSSTGGSARKKVTPEGVFEHIPVARQAGAGSPGSKPGLSALAFRNGREQEEQEARIDGKKAFQRRPARAEPQVHR
ncbi:TPA: hypothetical protein ACXJW0_005934, partial [Pseudomonas aeruginosa]